ncbi:MAG: response regulator transcription factor [Gammaproteobacteria bacterium]
MRIAVLEDDLTQVEVLKDWFNTAGHECYCFSDGNSYMDALRKDTYDLLVLDWNLPDTTGIKILSWMRTTLDWNMPVLFTTSRDREEDIVMALNSGADDYMIKPISRNETLARITALLRRALPSMDTDNEHNYPPFIFNLKNKVLTKNDQPISLTHKEFQLALLMFQNNGRLLSRSYILEHVWGVRSEISTRTVDTHISRIRNKLGIQPDSGWRLSAVYQHGYRLEPMDIVEA